MLPEAGQSPRRGAHPSAPQLWLAGAAALRHFDAARLSAADRRRWTRMLSAARRAEWMGSRALLAAHGPARGAASSLAHSGGFAALAAGPARMRMGVDLERVRKRAFGRLAEFAFDAREAAALQSLPVSARAEHFYVLWTLKEAAAKALNIGLWRALRECVFIRGARDWQVRLPTTRDWRAWVYAPRRDLVLALVCVSADEHQVWRAPRCREWPADARRAARWQPRVQLSRSARNVSAPRTRSGRRGS